MGNVGGVGSGGFNSGGSGYYDAAAGKAAASASDISTDKKFADMLSGGGGKAQPLPDIQAGEYKDYWTWMGRQIRGEAAKEAMGAMKITPQQLAALPISQRADLERKIISAAEERMRGLIDPQGGGTSTTPGTGQTPGGQTPGGQTPGGQTSGGQHKGGWQAGGWIPGLPPPTYFPMKPGNGQPAGGKQTAGGKPTANSGTKQTPGTTPVHQSGGPQKSGGQKNGGQTAGWGTTGRGTTGATPAHNGIWTGGTSRISHGSMPTLLAGQEVKG